MKLKEILTVEFDSKFADLEICGVTSDSRTVRENYAFVCIDGSVNDGHKYALKAVENGACIIIAERDTGAENQIIVEDTHEIYALMCAKYFGEPAKELKIIGVTGTNGKTSTTYILKGMLEKLGHKTGVIGTIQNLVGDEVLPAKNTTPDAFELHSLLSIMLKSNCEYVLMEVSSHALDQKRVFGLELDVAILTNITQDHLDYHKTFDNYIAAKQKIFDMCKNAVINFDDSICREISKDTKSKCDTYTYSVRTDESTFTAKNVRFRADGSDFEFVGNGIIGRAKLNIPGEFSVYNAMGAITALVAIGFPFADLLTALPDVKSIKGRAEIVPTDTDFTVIIDYAHTPDGLENILKTFSRFNDHRIVTVFGCGGDRDRTKRPVMGEVASKFSDFCIVTSDNPRTEQPAAIIDDITAGMVGTKTPYVVIENRVQAIEYAIENAKTNDIIILAGKGHETYQILADGTIHLDEREVVAKALSKR